MAQNLTVLHQFESLPTCDEFQPKDYGEAERYIAVREALLKYMLQEPTVKELLERLDKKVGLSKLVTAVAQANDHDRDAASRELVDCVLSLSHAIGPEIKQAVETWGLPWLWMDRGLLRAFVLQHIDAAIGKPLLTWTEMQKDELDINLKISSGTSDDEVEAAFDRIRQAYKKNLLQPGRAPMTKKKNAEMDAKKGAHLDRNAYWYVRHKIGGVHPCDLAKAHFGDDFQNLLRPDTTITKGIKAVEDLLNLTSYIRSSNPQRK